MTIDKLLRLSILAVIFIVFWFMGQKEHQGIQPDSSNAISLQRFLSFIFGRSASGNLYSIRGIMGQLLVFCITVIYSLNILEYIPDQDLTKYFLVSGLILAFLWILLIMVFRSKRLQ